MGVFDTFPCCVQICPASCCGCRTLTGFQNGLWKRLCREGWGIFASLENGKAEISCLIFFSPGNLQTSRGYSHKYDYWILLNMYYQLVILRWFSNKLCDVGWGNFATPYHKVCPRAALTGPWRRPNSKEVIRPIKALKDRSGTASSHGSWCVNFDTDLTPKVLLQDTQRQKEDGQRQRMAAHFFDSCDFWFVAFWRSVTCHDVIEHSLFLFHRIDVQQTADTQSRRKEAATRRYDILGGMEVGIILFSLCDWPCKDFLR